MSSDFNLELSYICLQKLLSQFGVHHNDIAFYTNLQIYKCYMGPIRISKFVTIIYIILICNSRYNSIIYVTRKNTVEATAIPNQYLEIKLAIYSSHCISYIIQYLHVIKVFS